MTIKFPLLIFIYVSICWTAILGESKTLFSPGQEYTYLYETLVTTGTEEPVSFASAYRLRGNLRVQANSANVLNVKLDDLTVGLYNGPWSYFPIPNFEQTTSVADTDLGSLSGPFQIHTENGKFKLLVMNDQEPEFASNMKRGIATYLQMDLSTVKFDKVGLSKISEATTMGECDTKYEVLPAEATKLGISVISKFRNHADCPDIPSRTRFSTKIFYACPDKQTRNIMNSTSYSTYAIDNNSDPDKVTIKQIVVFSSVLYWPFTVKSAYLYTWLNMTISLANVGPVTNPISPPENPENHEDLSFVFEQNDLNDPEEEVQDFRSAEPFLFHHTTGENEAEILQGIMEQLHKTTADVAQSLIENNNWEDVDNFHKNSPFSIIPLVASLDYDSLKHCYQRYSDAVPSKGLQASIELQLFLDGLVLSGNWPSTLAVRDVLLSTEDPKILFRILPAFPHFVRNPTEALAKELEPLFELTRKSTLDKNFQRMMELSMATLISKCCQKSLCVATGLLDKYTTYFEDKLGNDHFETQTVGVLGLRNLGIGKSLNKVLEIAEGKITVPRTVRVQAIWALRPLAQSERQKVFDALLPIFYNRAESCETRTTVFNFLMSCHPNKRVLHEIAYYMWTETCPQTKNIVRATLTNLANSKHPCNPSQAHASTILKYLPPGAVDPTRTASYAVDYYDDDHGFGHMTYATVQKSGKTALPVSVYVGLNAFIGGFATSYFGVFIRMQGLGKAVADKLSSLRSANVEDIQAILTKIGVSERSGTPLRLEVAVIYHDNVIAYFAADEKTIEMLPQFAKTMGDMRASVSLDWQRSLMLGGVLYQQPMEIGVPISVLTSITAIGSISAAITRGAVDGLLSQDNKYKLQFHTFGLTRVANHLPGLGTTHSITSRRTLRLALPGQSTLGLDIKNKAINIGIKPATDTNPIITIAHSTTQTSLGADSLSLSKQLKVEELLKTSCPTCSGTTVVSRGKAFRKSRGRDFKHPHFKGLKTAFKYFDCERDHSRKSMIQKFRHIFDPRSKNLGIFGNPVTTTILHVHQARDSIFYAPQAGTCGVSLSISQDKKDGNELEKIDSQIRGSIDPVSSKMSLETNLVFKYSPTSPAKEVKHEFFVTLEQPSLNSHKVDFKMVMEGPEDKANVVCMEMNINTNDIPKDLLGFQGENEPFLKETANVKAGKLTKSQLAGKNTPCSDERMELFLKVEARQSDEQKLEAKQDVYPYKACRDQKNSALYPGTKFVPPTTECHLSVAQQTKLQNLNVSYSYKVNQDVRKQLRKPLAFLKGLIQPYYVEADEATDHQSHDDHSSVSNNEQQTASEASYSGEIEVDFNLKPDSPTANVHYHGHHGGGVASSTSTSDEHYHDIELNLLPEVLTRPVSTRFSPLWVAAVKMGAFGICSATPQIVKTFDGASLVSQLPDCLTLLSADCGKNPQFAILAKKLTAETIGLVIHIAEHKIELDGVSNVKVNGQAKNFPDRVIQQLPSSSIQVLKNGEEIYIWSRLDAINVRYTGNFVTVTLGSRYRTTQCGLCGTFDSSPYNDLVGPDLQCAKPLSTSQFFNSYVLPEGQCQGGVSCPA